MNNTNLQQQIYCKPKSAKYVTEIGFLQTLHYGHYSKFNMIDLQVEASGLR